MSKALLSPKAGRIPYHYEIFVVRLLFSMLRGTTCRRNKEEEGSVDLAQFLDMRTQSSPFPANSFS